MHGVSIWCTRKKHREDLNHAQEFSNVHCGTLDYIDNALRIESFLDNLKDQQVVECVVQKSRAYLHWKKRHVMYLTEVQRETLSHKYSSGWHCAHPMRKKEIFYRCDASQFRSKWTKCISINIRQLGYFIPARGWLNHETQIPWQLGGLSRLRLDFQCPWPPVVHPTSGVWVSVWIGYPQPTMSETRNLPLG